MAAFKSYSTFYLLYYFFIYSIHPYTRKIALKYAFIVVDTILTKMVWWKRAVHNQIAPILNELKQYCEEEEDHNYLRDIMSQR